LDGGIVVRNALLQMIGGRKIGRPCTNEDYVHLKLFAFHRFSKLNRYSFVSISIRTGKLKKKGRSKTSLGNRFGKA